MNRSAIVIGLAAGAAAAFLFAAAGIGSFLSLVLFYAATLPLFIVGLGWGHNASIAATCSGAIISYLLAGLAAGTMFLVVFALPAAWLCYLALLSRADADDENAARNPQNWYPIGRLICWIAAIGAALTIVGMQYFDGSQDGFSTFIREALEPIPRGQTGAPEQPSPEDLERIADMLVQLIPVMLVTSWMMVTAINLYGGGKIALMSGRLLRPWPELQKIELPLRFSLVPVAAFLISFFPGWIGQAGAVVMTAAIGAYTIQGLSIVHDVTRGWAIRPGLLVLIYGTLILMAFPALLIAAIGLAEPMLNLRARAERARNTRPPGPT